MNKVKKDLILMDQILYKGIFDTDEWLGMHNDPFVAKDDAALNTMLESINSVITHEQMDNLQDAIYSHASSVACAAAIYGLRVADVLRSVSAIPDKLNRHIMERAEKDRAI